jgi:hypothetical protein
VKYRSLHCREVRLERFSAIWSHAFSPSSSTNRTSRASSSAVNSVRRFRVPVFCDFGAGRSPTASIESDRDRFRLNQCANSLARRLVSSEIRYLFVYLSLVEMFGVKEQFDDGGLKYFRLKS